MSPTVFPSLEPVASSDSLLVIEVKRTEGVLQASVATTDASTLTIRWLGGQRTAGSIAEDISGGIVSRTVTGNEQLARLPEASLVVMVTSVCPSG